MRDSVVFYRSFYEAVKDFPPEDFKKSVCAILEYGLNEKEPETFGIEKSIYLLTKPQIDANNKRYLNGTKGGRPKTKEEPNSNQEKTKTEPKEKEKVKEKVNNTSAAVDSSEQPCAGRFLLNDGTEYAVSENDVVTYQQLYPGIDVMQELRNVQAWCLSNPKNTKTRNGAKRFLNGWLSRAQNSARPEKKAGNTNKNKFNDFPQRGYDMDSLEAQLIGGKKEEKE